jgi:hypothetical protein
VLVLFASVVVACNKGPAEDALRVADQAIAAAQPELETYAPGELAALNAAVRQARAQVSEGHYTDALRAAQEVPARVRAALAVAAAEKQKRLASWSALEESVPRLAETIGTRIAWFTEAQRLPRGMDEAGFAAARAELASVKRGWGEASAVFDRGDVATAVQAGREVEAKAGALAARLGLVVPSPPSAAEPTPSPTAAALAP